VTENRRTHGHPNPPLTGQNYYLSPIVGAPNNYHPSRFGALTAATAAVQRVRTDHRLGRTMSSGRSPGPVPWPRLLLPEGCDCGLWPEPSFSVYPPPGGICIRRLADFVVGQDAFGHVMALNIGVIQFLNAAGSPNNTLLGRYGSMPDVMYEAAQRGNATTVL